MSTKPAWLDRAAQRMIESDGADYGDERERTVAMEGQAFGMQLAVWVCWLGALLMALTGQLVAPLALILAALLPVLGSNWYTRRRGMSSYALISRAPMGRTLGWTLLYGVVLFLTIAAMTYRAYFGEGIWNFTVRIEVVGDELQRVVAASALVGAGVGVLVGTVWMSLIVWKQRQTALQQQRHPEDDLD